MEHQKDGGAVADVERSTSLTGDEKYSRNKELRSEHSSPSPEFPSLLPLLAGQLFTVPCEIWGNEWRLTGRGKNAGNWNKKKKRPGGQMGCYAEDNKSLNNGIIKSKEGDRALRLRNRQLCRSNIRLQPGTAIWWEPMLQMQRARRETPGQFPKVKANSISYL